MKSANFHQEKPKNERQTSVDYQMSFLLLVPCLDENRGRFSQHELGNLEKKCHLRLEKAVLLFSCISAAKFFCSQKVPAWLIKIWTSNQSMTEVHCTFGQLVKYRQSLWTQWDRYQFSKGCWTKNMITIFFRLNFVAKILSLVLRLGLLKKWTYAPRRLEVIGVQRTNVLTHSRSRSNKIKKLGGKNPTERFQATHPACCRNVFI